jgi:hypothetical protein
MSGGIASPFLTTELDGGEWLALGPCRFTPREKFPKYPLDRIYEFCLELSVDFEFSLYYPDTHSCKRVLA